MSGVSADGRRARAERWKFLHCPSSASRDPPADAIFAYQFILADRNADPSEYLRLESVDNPDKYTVLYNYMSNNEVRARYYDPKTDKMLICGVGQVPKDCGVGVSKKLFAPRFGIAWRPTNSWVIRTGYGLTYDPFSLQRPFRTNYPVARRPASASRAPSRCIPNS